MVLSVYILSGLYNSGKPPRLCRRVYVIREETWH